MTNEAIKKCWERAKELAYNIQRAIWFAGDIEQARKDQLELRAWIGKVKEEGIVYNGCYDEYLVRTL